VPSVLNVFLSKN